MSSDAEDDPYASEDENGNDDSDPYGSGDDNGGDDSDPYGSDDEDDDDDNGSNKEEEEEVEEVKQIPIVWKFEKKGTYDVDMIHDYVMENVIRRTVPGSTRSEKIALLRSQRWSTELLNEGRYFDNEDKFRKAAGLRYEDFDIDDVLSTSTDAYRQIPKDKSPTDTFECPILWEDYPFKSSFTLPGGHRISEPAIVQQLTETITRKSQQALFSKYEGHTLPDVLFGSDGPLNAKLQRMYKTRAVEHFIECMDDQYRRCKNPRCALYLSKLAASESKKGQARMVISADDDDGAATKSTECDARLGCFPVRCAGCDTEQCFRCGETRHTPCTCTVVKRWQEKNKDTDATAILIRNTTRPCPKCKQMVGKNGGCLKMDCPKCGANFCFACGASPYHPQSGTGGYFRCEVAEKKTKIMRTNSASAAKSRAEEKAILRAEEYNDTFSKFLQYQNAADDADTNFRQFVQTLKDDLFRSPVLSESMIALRYLDGAVEEARIGSLANAWTSVYRYFEYDDPDDEVEYERETNLLNTYQSNLEHYISDLLTIIKEGPKRKKLAEDRSAYASFKTQVQKVSASIRRFRTSIMDDIENGFPTLQSVTDRGLEQHRKEAWKYAQKWLDSKGLDAFGRKKSSFMPPHPPLEATKRRHRGQPQWVLKLINLQRQFPGRPWEEMIPKRKLPDEPVWAWCDSAGVWNPYADSIIKQIEDARLKKGQSQVTIESAGRKYTIDWTSNSQTNVDTHGSRQIRRTMENPRTRNWTCESCNYRNLGGTKSCSACHHRRKLRGGMFY